MTNAQPDYRLLATRARAALTPDFRGGEIDLGWTNLRGRFANGTHIARGAGIVATCTVSAGQAVQAWARKAEDRAAEVKP